MLRYIALTSAILLFAAQPAISGTHNGDGVVGYNGYDCSAALHGIPDLPGGFTGGVGAAIRLDDSGKVTKSIGNWRFVGPVEWTTGPAPWKYNNPVIKLIFERPNLDLSLPLKPASLSLEVSTPMPPQPTDMVVTLNSGEFRRLPHVTPAFFDHLIQTHWTGRVGPAGIIKDPAFLAALSHASAMTIEVYQADGTRIFRSVVSFNGAAAVPQIVQRLDREAIAATKDYQHRCSRIETDYLIMK